MASGRKPSICNTLSQIASLIPSNYDGTADENGITIPPHLNYYRPSKAQLAAQAASDEADGAIYEKPLCTVFCCCNANPSISRDGKKRLRQACVHDVLSAANSGNCPCKSEQTFYMTQPQPTWRDPKVRPSRGFAKKLLARYGHIEGYKARRRPDVICLHDPHGPFAPYNIAVIVEMKFPGDKAQLGQVKAYKQIAGGVKGKVKLMTEETCGCRKKSKKTEAEETQAKTAKKSAEEAAFVAAMIRGGIYIAKGAAIVVGGAVANFAGQL